MRKKANKNKPLTARDTGSEKACVGGSIPSLGTNFLPKIPNAPPGLVRQLTSIAILAGFTSEFWGENWSVEAWMETNHRLRR
jgi:hypothetical protein